MNRIILLGNMTRDVELRHMQSGSAIGGFGLAHNRKWKSADGQDREEVLFVDCEAFGKLAENIAKFFHKGSRILIEGRLKLDQWEDKQSGERRSKIKIVVEGFDFVDSKKQAEDNTPAGFGRPPKGAKPVSIERDDIPF